MRITRSENGQTFIGNRDITQYVEYFSLTQNHGGRHKVHLTLAPDEVEIGNLRVKNNGEEFPERSRRFGERLLPSANVDLVGWVEDEIGRTYINDLMDMAAIGNQSSRSIYELDQQDRDD